MAIKMGLNLALGFGRKPRFHLSPKAPAKTPIDRTEIPQRVEDSSAPSSAILFRPGKMLRFLIGNLTQRIPTAGSREVRACPGMGLARKPHRSD